MRPKTNLFPAVLTSLGLVSFAFAAARPDDPPLPASPPAKAATAPPTVLLLANGRIIQGEITKVGRDVLVKQRGGVIRRPQDQVEGIFRSLDEAYEFRRDQLPELDPDEHLKLARWCLTQNLQDSAKKEVLTVLKVSPKSNEAKAMLVSIEAAETRQHDAPTYDPGLVRTAGEMPEAARPGQPGRAQERQGPARHLRRPRDLQPSALDGRPAGHAVPAAGSSGAPGVLYQVSQ